MNTFQSILDAARREFRAVVAEKWTAVTLFLVPLIAGAVLTGIYFEKIVRDVPTMVVDRDGSAASRALIRALDANESIAVTREETTDNGIEQAMRDGTVQCAVEIPQGFERDLKEGKQVQVLCYSDGSNVLTANYAVKGVSTVVSTISAGVGSGKLAKTGVPSSHALATFNRIAIASRVLYNPGQNYADFFLPGVLSALLQQVMIIGAALSLVRSRAQGDALRHPAVEYAGRMLVYVGIGVAWAVVFYCGMFAVGGVPFYGSAVAGAAAIVLMLAAMVSLGMMISALVSDGSTAMQYAFIVSSPAFIMSGYTFPQLAVAPVIRWAGECMPLTPFLKAWRRIVLYGAGVEAVWLQLLSMAIMTAVFLGAAEVVRRLKLSNAAEGGRS